MAHPIRARILWMLAEEEGQSAADLAERLSVPVRSIRHQLSKLAEQGLVAVIDSRDKRGAREKFYEVRVRPVLDAGDYEAMSPQLRRLAAAESFLPLVRDIERALEAGSLTWNDSSLVRIGAEVDEEGWRTISATVEHAFGEIEVAAEQAAIRIEERAGHERQVKRAVSGLLWFERPRIEDPDWDPTARTLLPARQLIVGAAAQQGGDPGASMRLLAGAMAHPVRAKILFALSDTHPLAVGQIAERIHAGEKRVRYHLTGLVRGGLVREAQDPGRRKRYALGVLPILWTEELDELEPEEAHRIAGEIFRRILIDVAGAIFAGIYYRRTDFWQLRIPIEVDEEGWAEIQALSVRLLEDIESAHAEAAARLRETGAEPVVATAAIVWAELPPR